MISWMTSDCGDQETTQSIAVKGYQKMWSTGSAANRIHSLTVRHNIRVALVIKSQNWGTETELP